MGDQHLFVKLSLIGALLLILFGVCVMMTSCTYNVSMVHTEGEASDVVDSEQTPTTETNADLNLSKI